MAPVRRCVSEAVVDRHFAVVARVFTEKPLAERISVFETAALLWVWDSSLPVGKQHIEENYLDGAKLLALSLIFLPPWL